MKTLYLLVTVLILGCSTNDNMAGNNSIGLQQEVLFQKI